MKITIELDPTTNTGSASQEDSTGTRGGLTAHVSEAQPSATAPITPPAEVLALAAQSGAINGGPAPAAGAHQGASAPNLYHSHGAGPAPHDIASAISAGPAQDGKPCG